MSRYGYLEVFQSPLEFEITRVDCNIMQCNTLQHSLTQYDITFTYTFVGTLYKKDMLHMTNFSLILLNPDIPCFANSVDPDQLASEEAT